MCYVDAKFLILDKSNNKRHNFEFKDFAAHRQTEFGKVKTSLNQFYTYLDSSKYEYLNAIFDDLFNKTRLLRRTSFLLF